MKLLDLTPGQSWNCLSSWPLLREDSFTYEMVSLVLKGHMQQLKTVVGSNSEAFELDCNHF